MLSPILVTGSHRSGSTWVGKCIESSDQIVYLAEPLRHTNSMQKIYFNDLNAKIWFPAIKYQSTEIYNRAYEKIFYNGFHFYDLNFSTYRGIKDSIKVLRDINLNNKRRLLKDPIALFSADWLYENYHTQNIVLIRSPLAFISSLKKNNWHHNFNDFLVQRELMKNELKPFSSKIEKYSVEKHSVIDQGILLANIFNQQILSLKIKYPDWHFIELEKLQKEPFKEFETIFKYLNMTFSTKTKEYILQTTSSNNITDRSDDNVHVLERNSAELVNVYKSRLTPQEIEKISKETNDGYHKLLNAIT